MRKLFLLLPALVLSLITNAKEIEISSTTSNIIHSTIAASTTSDGDVIVLTDAGPYVNSKANSDDYTKIAKNVTIKAADGIQPVIKFEVPIQARYGKSGKFIGIKFDGSSLQYDQFIFVEDDDLNDNELEFEDCEFYNFSKYIVNVRNNTKANSLVFKNCKFYNNSTNRGILNQGNIGRLELDGCEVSNFVKEFIHGYSGTSHVDECVVNDCYFHDNSRSSIMFVASTVDGTQTCDQLTVTNSTFANIDASGEYESVIDIRPYGTAATDAIQVLVDHCTFYNNTVINSDHANIRTAYLSDVTVSNCIFYYPSEYATRATYCTGGGNINNCLTYNYTAEGTKGHAYGATVNAASIVADPLFDDLVNNKYSYSGDWTATPMSLSPARGAATDGSDLGDPRWYSAETLPSTDFASPYAFVGAKAQITGNIWYDSENGYLYGDGAHNIDYGTAAWKFHAEKACVLGIAVNLNSGNSSGHKLRVEVLDADGNKVDEFAEQASTLPGTLTIPAVGDYKIILHDDQTWSSAKIDNVTLSYIGGEVQAMPGTTNINDAWFSANGTRADGKITYSSISSGCWAKWNINVASAGTYNVIVNISGQHGHDYTVEFLKEGESTPIIVTKGVIDYTNDPTLYANELGSVTLEAANYEMKVLNSVGDAALHSVTLSYAGGAAIDLSKTTPASLLANADAILSDDWTIEDGKITHVESKALTGWAKWNVNCADYANYNVTVNISSDNGHGVRVEVFEDEAQPAIYTMDEPSSGKYHTGDLALDLGSIVLADRDYVVKITNTVSSSHAKITSIVITYLNGAQATLPATFNFEDGMLSEKAHITAGELWFNTIGDSNPVGQWAKWNVKVAEAGTFLFTMNTNSTNDQKYKVTILDENDNEIDAFESKGYSSGAVEIKHYFNLAAGNYTVKLENTKSWSQGHIVSLMVTQPSLLVLNEAAETNTVIHDNYRNGAHDIQIIRTIVAGMYNTICLPFDVNSTQLQAIFGSDVELRQMSSAELNGNELDLNFEAATSIYRGTPYLIKTSKTVTNPVFADVEIKEKTGQATSTDKVDFIGSFIKGEVPAGEDNLFLGQNDMLYFSSTATPIKGMRAWFKVKVPNPQHVIQHARIVTGGQVVTSIDLVNGDIVNETVKTIENGQLVIIRDGVRYNAMGIRLQ